MTQDKKNTILSVQTMDDRINGHKVWLMSKKRTKYCFEEQVDLKLKELKCCMYKDIISVDNWVMRHAYYKEPNQYEYTDEQWKPIKVGEYWGGKDMSCFFRQTVKIPSSMKGEKVVLQMFLGGDSLVSINGQPYQGMDPFRNIVVLTQKASGDEVFDISVESYCFYSHDGEGECKLVCSSIASIDTEMEQIYWDFVVVFNSLQVPNIDPKIRDYIQSALHDALLTVDQFEEDEKSFKENLQLGRNILKEKIYNCNQLRLDGKIFMIGQSHLDVVYLWPYKEFIRKAGRTHSSMLRLMEEFPDFIFSQSQPLMYREIKKNYPELYEQIKQRVAEGRWEVIGGMWVEPDCNLISGESFVRQIMFGSRFIQEEFGIKPRTCWLPDVFGNCYTMPQILKKSGIEYFVTHKPSVWNDTNPWSVHNFWWEGPDGSRVFAALSPTHFVGTAEPAHVMDNWEKYSDKTSIGESIYCYGWGDGGGGVNADMLHNIKRCASYPGMPEIVTSRVEDALDSMRLKASQNLPVLKDEIYLEAHRGVHTTKGKLKKLNRYCENLYREAEIYSSIAMSMEMEYPYVNINEGWEEILTNQFHDALTGTHINEVYGQLLSSYNRILAIGEDARKKALQQIASDINVKALGDKAFTVFNSLPYENTSLAYLDEIEDDEEIVDADGENVEWQRTVTLENKQRIIFIAENVPPVGYKTYYIKKRSKHKKHNCCSITNNTIQGTFFKIKFNEIGEITSVFDMLEEREVINAEGRGNVFKLYEDIPSRYDAWDIVDDYLERELHLEPGKLEVLENGPVFASLLLTKSIRNSKIRQKIIVYNKLQKIDFETEIDWVERQKLLKVGFDVDIMAKTYTSDIAYGNIERPNYRFNSFEKAKFEVNAHNWIDMSQEDYGVSILNDCKYGFDVTNQTMSISLLKGPVNPDPESDIETHYFTYSLLPHKGNWKKADTNRRGLEMNNPLQVVKLVYNKGKLPEQYSFISVGNSNVTLEAVKKAENSNELIVRVLERYGMRVKTFVKLQKDIKAVSECDLMEINIGGVEFASNKLCFELKPYEVKTFKVSFHSEIK